MHAISGEEHAYASLSITKGWEIMAPKFIEFERKFAQYKGTFEYVTARRIVHVPTERTFRFFGLSSLPDVETLRGSRYPIGWIDECGSVKSDILRSALVEAMGPATNDFRGSPMSGIRLMGTASKEYGGYWHQLSEGSEGGAVDLPGLPPSRHYWEMADNPLFGPRATQIEEEILAENGWERSSPEWLREYRAKHVLDTIGSCFPSWSRHEPHSWDGVPRGYRVLYSANLQHLGDSALVVACQADGGGPIYVLSEHFVDDRTLQGLVDWALEIQGRFGPGIVHVPPSMASYIDALKEMGLPCRVADYGSSIADGAAQLDLLDSQLASGRFRLRSDTSPLALEIRGAYWDDDENSPHKTCSQKLLPAILPLASLWKREAPPAPVETLEQRFLREKQDRIKAAMRRGVRK